MGFHRFHYALGERPFHAGHTAGDPCGIDLGADARAGEPPQEALSPGVGGLGRQAVSQKYRAAADGLPGAVSAQGSSRIAEPTLHVEAHREFANGGTNDEEIGREPGKLCGRELIHVRDGDARLVLFKHLAEYFCDLLPVPAL